MTVSELARIGLAEQERIREALALVGGAELDVRRQIAFQAVERDRMREAVENLLGRDHDGFTRLHESLMSVQNAVDEAVLSAFRPREDFLALAELAQMQERAIRPFIGQLQDMTSTTANLARLFGSVSLSHSAFEATRWQWSDPLAAAAEQLAALTGVLPPGFGLDTDFQALLGRSFRETEVLWEEASPSERAAVHARAVEFWSTLPLEFRVLAWLLLHLVLVPISGA